MKSKKFDEKCIRVAIRNGDDTKVKVNFYGGVFSPDEFTSLFMAVLETYTASLLETNNRRSVYEHFNKVFGIFLNKILSEEEIYDTDFVHKKFKENTDKILREETAEDRKATEENRFAAYLLARDILVKEMGLSEDSADLVLNKRLNNLVELKAPLDTKKVN